MQAQVKDIDRPAQSSIGKHGDFFEQMRLWRKGGETQRECADQ